MSPFAPRPAIGAVTSSRRTTLSRCGASSGAFDGARRCVEYVANKVAAVATYSTHRRAASKTPELAPHLLSVVIAHAKTAEMPWIEFRDGQDNVVIHRGLSLPPVMSPADQRAALRHRKPAFRVRDTDETRRP